MTKGFTAGMVNSYRSGDRNQPGARRADAYREEERPFLVRPIACSTPNRSISFAAKAFSCSIAKDVAISMLITMLCRWGTVIQEVVEAICDQGGDAEHAHALPAHDNFSTMPNGCARRFRMIFPTSCSSCTGSESNDPGHPDGEGVHTPARFHRDQALAYHGVTDAASSRISPSLGPDVERGPFVRTVPAPDLYRSPTGDVGAEFAAGVRAAIDDLRAQGIGLAARSFAIQSSRATACCRIPGVASGSCGRRQDRRRPRSLRTKSRRVSGAPAKACGASIGTVSFPISPRSANRWAMAIRSRGCGEAAHCRGVQPDRTLPQYVWRQSGVCAAALATLKVIEDEHLIRNAQEVRGLPVRAIPRVGGEVTPRSAIFAGRDCLSAWS